MSAKTRGSAPAQNALKDWARQTASSGAKKWTIVIAKTRPVEPAKLVKSLDALPVVEPGHLLVVRRPDELHAYARGLLEHLRRIRAGGNSEGYTITLIKSAAVWLIKSYARARIPPAPEAAELVYEIVQPDRDASTSPVRRSSEKAYWAAIAFEARQRRDPAGKKPSAATLYAVAQHVRPMLRRKGTSQKNAEGIVRNWRRLPHYRANVALRRRLSTEWKPD
jgi:hypothetical protein